MQLNVSSRRKRRRLNLYVFSKNRRKLRPDKQHSLRLKPSKLLLIRLKRRLLKRLLRLRKMKKPRRLLERSNWLRPYRNKRSKKRPSLKLRLRPRQARLKLVLKKSKSHMMKHLPKTLSLLPKNNPKWILFQLRNQSITLIKRRRRKSSLRRLTRLCLKLMSRLGHI